MINFLNISKFLVFSGYDCYPEGGFKDFDGSFDSYDEALNITRNKCFKEKKDWFQIIDISNSDKWNFHRFQNFKKTEF